MEESSFFIASASPPSEQQPGGPVPQPQPHSIAVSADSAAANLAPPSHVHRQSRGGKPRILGKISSDVAVLDKLQPLYKWLPNSLTVRPSEAGKAAKRARLQLVEQTYSSFPDYILCSIYGRASGLASDGSGRLRALDVSLSPSSSSALGDAEMRFLPNEFPYAIDASVGHHSVLWYACVAKHKDDEAISRDIYDLLAAAHGPEAFDFAWYENPKMTVPEFYHVQVFWTLL